MALIPNPALVKYIKECRLKGFEDFQIRIALVDENWPLDEISRAFQQVKEQEERKLKKVQKVSENKTIYVYKNTLTIHLDSEITKLIEKRAKKNMLTPAEQVEDIVRRSCVNQKKKSSDLSITDNVDDNFLKLFSRKTAGKPRGDKSVKW